MPEPENPAPELLADAPPATLPAVSPDVAEQEKGLADCDTLPQRGDGLPIVGLGASAGGIPALQEFFRVMPPDSGMAFVVVIHLSPERESALAEMLQRGTTMRVHQAKDGVKLEPNTVYVIPPAKHLTAVDGVLRLANLPADLGKRVAVDLFFRSLADCQGADATAIVLSGADGDGAIGIKRIKERGGLTIAQEPDEAEHPSMPRTAIDTGMVDWVLPVKQMPTRLLEYRARGGQLELPPEDGPPPAASAPPKAPGDHEQALREVLAFVRAQTGRDFLSYKRATILRRIARRMQVNGVFTLGEYLDFLRLHPGETGALLQDLLISVTNFFRDRDCFAVVEQMIPQIFAGKQEGDSVRVWVAGCASGEEAYSIAMLLLEHASLLDNPPSIQVFATDLNTDVVASARHAYYPHTIEADVTEERLRRFFTREHRGYQVRRELRECVLFAVHDLLKDSPFSKLDLVSCRNLLIYLNRDAQQQALELFHFALRSGGRLFLGTAESLDEETGLFHAVDKKHRLFVKAEVPRTGSALIGPGVLARNWEPVDRASRALRIHGPAFARHAPRAVEREAELSEARVPSWEELHYKLIERFAPPSLIVDRDYEIVHVSENAGRFLHFASGEPSMNLMRVIHPMLRIELRAALFRAAQTNAAVEVFRVPLELNGQRAEVDLRVCPSQEIARDYLLVVFTLRENADPASARQSAEAEPAARQLERENEQMKARLQDTIEQYEASVEELKASNEELQAMNEELRSSTEELETGREELQSVNEELSTVNQELKSKVDLLGQANSDLSNLMSATAIATIFVDRSLRIMRYTPSAVALFSLIPSDVGRPLTDLTHQLNYPELSADANRAIETLAPIRREASDGHGGWYLVQLLPYRTTDDHIAGAVLTFVDITESRNAEVALRESEERLRFATEAANIYGWEFDPVTLQTHYAGNTERVLGFSLPSDIQDMIAYLHPDDRGEVSEIFEKAFKERTPFHAEFRLVHPRTGQAVWQSSHGLLIDRGGAPRFVGITQNISARKQAEHALSESQERLRLAQEAGEVGIWDWNIETGESYWSEALWRLFGYPDPTGLDPRVVWKKHLLPEDRARVDSVLGRLLGSAATEFRTEFRVQCRDGRLRWLESVARITRDDEGRAVRMMGVNFDVTERKEADAALRSSEERLRLIVENAREYAIVSIDLERRIQSWNSGAQAILGYTQIEAIGRSGDMIFVEEDRAAGAPEAEALKALTEGRAADERWHVRKDGSRFWGSGVMMAMHNAQEAVGFVKIFRDQTAEREAKEALERGRQELWAALQENERARTEAEKARAEAEAAGRAKDHFLAVLSHELRTPLTPVLMGLRTLSRTRGLPAAAAETIAMIHRNVELESHFIDDLLDVTRISRGKLELISQPLDLHESVRRAVEIAHPDLEAKNQRLILMLAATEHEITGDPKRLQQAFWNLLKNASKFSPEGSEIRLSSRNEPATEEEPRRILVEVADRGVGFDPEAAERIFLAFAQAHEGISREYGGLGLGLSIAKATVEAHGGRVRAESAGPGKGATFMVALPLGGEVSGARSGVPLSDAGVSWRESERRTE